MLLLAACVQHDLYEARKAELSGDDTAGCETRLWYADADGDGHGDIATTTELCEAPDGYVDSDGDCDDANAAVHPDADELCSTVGVDDDCDGQVDDATAADAATLWPDGDGDGFGTGDGATGCEADGVDQGGDCDDTDPAINPGATETWYDDIDQDCSGGSDHDADGDGYEAIDALDDRDCDDTDPAINPGATELWYDGVDQDCSGGSDFDADGDGHTYEDTDCDDTDAAINPDAEEICGDGVDQDCDDGPGACGLPVDADSTDAPLSATPGDDAGSWVGIADIGGDGVTDVVVGAVGMKANNYASGGFLILDTSLAEVGTLTGEYFGGPVGEVADMGGDIDGDGAVDLIVGLPGWRSWTTSSERGKAYFEYGALSGTNSLYYPDAAYKGRKEKDRFGTAVLILADYDGDGEDDYAITAPRRDDGGSDSGSIYLYSNTPNDETSNQNYDVELVGRASSAFLGSAIASGDHDGDGDPEIVLVEADTTSANGGRVYLVSGLGNLNNDEEQVDDVADLSWKASTDGDALGVHAGFDVNGDGYDDVLVLDSTDGTDDGAVWLHLGPLASLHSTNADQTIEGRAGKDDACGTGVTTGDYDGDGTDDLSIVCSGYETSTGDAAVVTFYGANLSLTGTVEADEADSIIEDPSTDFATGLDAGDLDGDGYDDLVLGAPTAESVYVFYGGPGI